MGAAFASVCRLENADSRWATIPWIWYFASIGVGIAGVVVLRKAKKEDHADEEKTEAEYTVIQKSLASLQATVKDLCNSEPTPSVVLHRIDDECAESFSDFVDARQSLVKRYGMTVYADVMTEFASAERYVNRSWSAAADGYVDEVSASLRRADHHLQKAGELLNAAESSAALAS